MSPASMRGLEDFHLAGEQEVGVRVGRVALDEDVVALRLHREHGARLHAADFLVVEGDVEGVRVLDQAVIADHRNAFVDGLLRRPGRWRRCPGPERSGRWRPARSGSRRRSAAWKQRTARRPRCTWRRLPRCTAFIAGFVGLPALFLEVVPGHADDKLLRHCRTGHTGKHSCAQKGDCKEVSCFPPVRTENHPACRIMVAAFATGLSNFFNARKKK